MAGPNAAKRLNPNFPLGADAASVRQRIEAMEQLLERSVAVPGLNRRIGLDAIVGLLPVAGDLVGAALGLYLIWEARNLGMSKWHLARMLANVGFDTVVGSVPLVGDAFDFVFRSNSRNLRMISRYLDKHHPHTRIIDA